MAEMLAYDWPGNVRELRNLIERAMILTQSSTLHVTLGRAPVHTASLNGCVGTLEHAERTHILIALEQCRWRIRGSRGAGQLLDIKPTTLESRMKKLGITRPR
jgi:formate hydrogenlyase transcriptional activator